MDQIALVIFTGCIYIVTFRYTSALLSDRINQKYLADLPNRISYKDGDLLLAGLFSIHTFDSNEFCSEEVFEPAVYHAVAMQFAIEKINNDSSILPKHDLGFVIFDECQKTDLALARASHLIPDKTVLSQTLSSTNFPYYDTVGLVGPATSSSAELVSKVLGFYHIPVISVYATKDSLSDKAAYPYFMRTVPEDHHQVTVISALLDTFNWTYVAGIYQGTYGLEGLAHIQTLISARGGCFSAQYEISKSTTSDQYRSIVDNLLKLRSRVLVLYATVSEARRFFRAFNERGAEKHLIVVASDGLGGSTLNKPESVFQLPEGLLVVNPYMDSVPEFDQYFQAITGDRASRDIVLRDFWQKQFRCRFSSGECDLTATFGTEQGFYTDSSVSLITDAVYTYAHALDAIINGPCSSQSRITADLKQCIKGAQLLKELKSVNFEGFVGPVSYADNGNIAAKFEVRNIQSNSLGLKVSRRVACLDVVTSQLTTDMDAFSWHPHFSHLVGHVPVSVCSQPCLIGQQRISMDNSCCWKCNDCRKNEITNANQTSCLPCPTMTWPDRNRTLCLRIVPDFLDQRSVEFLALLTAAGIGIVVNTFLFWLFVKNSEVRVIRASGRELMYLIFGGCYTMLAAVGILSQRPTTLICYCNYLTFCLSFTLIYAPLLVKTRRIYAIFHAAKKSTRSPMAISQLSQLLIVAALLAVQVILCAVSVAMWPPVILTTMPDPNRRHTELVCHFSNPGFSINIGYNVLLVLVCAVLAYKARSTPENFNESRFISFSVYTTLILFITFIPMYIHISGVLVKVLILSLMLLLNAYVVIFCLFAPKIYAVYYSADEEEEVARSFTTRVQAANGTPRKANLQRATTVS